MNCKATQKVWGHPGGFLEGLKTIYPGVLDRLERLIQNLVNGGTNSFDKAVKRKAGVIRSRYYVEHADDTEALTHQVHDVVGDTAARMELEHYFSQKFRTTVTIGNICCSGCESTLGRLTRRDVLAIQNAAVRTNADGSDIVL